MGEQVNLDVDSGNCCSVNPVPMHIDFQKKKRVHCLSSLLVQVQLD